MLDSISFWQYQPSSGIATLTDNVAFTDNGKFVFYATQPVLDGNRTFNARCDRKEQSAAILGCYVADRIYLYDVTDKRLDGIKEVTAVHEMLHAVYQRLSPSEKNKIDALVEAEYEKLRSDADLSERMAFYARTEPGARDNELHSIIGTEVESVSPKLEAHFAKYVKDRKKIVKYHQAYRQAFTSLEAQRDALAKQLDAMSAKIKEASADYNSSTEKLEADIEAFNKRATSGDFSSQAQFNRERAALVARVNNLSGDRSAISDMISQYNALKDQYNETVTASNDLYKSIDSNLAPAPQV